MDKWMEAMGYGKVRKSGRCSRCFMIVIEFFIFFIAVRHAISVSVASSSCSNRNDPLAAAVASENCSSHDFLLKMRFIYIIHLAQS